MQRTAVPLITVEPTLRGGVQVFEINGSRQIRCAVRRALVLSAAAAGMGGANAALAQEAGAQPDDDSSVEEVTITGSRLLRSRDLAASSPVQSIELDELQLSGNVTLEDTLNQFPQLNPDNTGTVNQSGGAGVLSADLRGLGSVRTLVLVNGRRYVPADVTGLVDLSTIPDSLVERVEIITGGASAVYGSDAVAGAVNFILRDDFEGAEFKYQYGETDRSDGQSRKIDMLLGANMADGRGNVTLHAAYTNRDPVYMGDREFSRQPLIENASGQLVPFGSGNIPGGLIGIPASQFGQIVGVDLRNTSGACPGAIQGVRFGDNGQAFPFCRPTEQYNYAAVNFLLRPLERWQLSTTGHFDLGANVSAYGEAYYTKKENEFQQAPEAVSPTSFGRETGTVVIPNADTNPLYPQALRDFFAANRAFFDSDNDGVYVVRSTSRRFEEFGPRNTSITSDSFNLTGGLRGDLALGGNDWKWDSYYQYGRSDVEFLQTGLLSRSRTTLGLDVVVVNGQPQCRIQLLNCVPVNIFGTNTLTPQMANFLSVSTSRADEFLRKMAGASLSGELLSLPAGPLATAVGIEWRREEFSTLPDEVQSSGDLAAQTVAPQPNSGDFEIFEVFAEFRAPLLDDLPAIRSLAVEGAVRFSDYTTIDSVTTWKGLLDWEIMEGIRLRGGLSRAIRAPNLNELFATPAAGFTGGVDPCWVTSNPSQATRDFCVQQGVPANVINTFLPGASQGWSARSGGNPDLQEEEADTLTVGAVLTPDWLGGVSVTVDYFDIEVEGAITQVASQLLVNSCFALRDLESTACRSISRLSNGLIDVVNAPLLNVASRTVSGVDVGIAYRANLPGWLSLPGNAGTLDLRVVSTWQSEDLTQTLTNLAPVECAGRYSGSCSGDGTRITPDLRGFFRADWRSGPLQIATELQLIGSLDLASNAIPNENGTLGEEYYLDLTANWAVTDDVKLFLGITNLLDNEPPVIGFTGGGDSNTNIPLFDPLGRRYFAGMSVTF